MAMTYVPKFQSYGRTGMTMLGAGAAALAGRSAYGRSYTRTTTKKRKYAQRQNSVKAQMLRVIDNHHSTQNDTNYAVLGATHNTIYTANITSVPVQGTSNLQRIGDKIHIQHVDLSFCVSSFTTAGAYTWRVMILWSGEEYNPAGTGSGLAASEIFLPNTGGNYVTSGIINPKAVTVLYDSVIDINSQVSAARDVVNVRERISINQDFMYQASGSIYGKLKSLYLVVVGTVQTGTSAVTVVGDINPCLDMVFKPL